MTDHTGRERIGKSAGAERVELRGWDAERVQTVLATSSEEARELLALVRSLQRALDRGQLDEAHDINDAISALVDRLRPRLDSVLRSGRGEAVRRRLVSVDLEDS